jgi:peptidyl-prolyl cis-trans isomerase SurA
MIRNLRLVASATFFAFIGCGGSAIVATVGTEKVSLEEFEDTYAKNNGGWDAVASSSVDDRQKFLDLIIKFKLKVQEAKAQGLLQDTSIQNELETYNISVAQSYMLEKELVEPRLKDMYQRKSEEIRASHVLFRLSPNPTPAETLAAYNKALNVLTKINRMSFDTLASAYSEDPTATFNKGDLGFFSVGRMVPEFEDACYALKAGEYTKLPVRTQFGYHIIKVFARQPNSGAVRISHLLKRFSQSQQDTAAVRDSVWALYYRIKQGAVSFEEAASKFSDDVGSSARSGDIGTYERTLLPPDMSAMLFSAPLDSILPPFRANYGYHIFKVTEKRGIPPFTEVEKDLRQQYQQLRYEKDRKKYIQNLKSRYRLFVDSAQVEKLIRSVDTTKVAGSPEWFSGLFPDFLKQPVMSAGKRVWTVRDVAEKAGASQELKSLTLTASNVWMIVDRLSDDLVLEEHASTAGERHPAFRKLMQEYLDGILLYRIEQDEIWKKVVVNDSLLRHFYEANREKYRWPERVNFAEIFVTSDSLARRAYWKLRYGEDFLSVAEEFTMRSGYREKLGVWGFQPLTLNELSRRASQMAIDSISPPFKHQNGWSIIKTLGRDSARVKTFEEAGPELVSAFQEQAAKTREQEWVDSLKKKFGVTLHKEALTDAFKRKRLENR